MNWNRIVLNKSDIDDVTRLIILIADKIEAKLDKIKDMGLLSGKLGISIFYIYCYKLTLKKKYDDVARNLINEVYNEIGNIDSYTFDMGLSGIGWATDFLNKEDYLDVEESFFIDIDNYLNPDLNRLIKLKDYNYFKGILGLSQYYKTRSPKVKNDFFKKVVGSVEMNAIKDVCNQLYLTHKIKDNKGHSIDVVSFGVAHGLSGIISMLNIAAENNIYKSKAEYLLRCIFSFMYECRNDSNSICYFPLLKDNSGFKEYGRMNWKLGDIGIANTLYRSSIILNDEQIRKIALEVYDSTLKRRDIQQTGISTISFTSGSAGIAHLYNVIYQYTKLNVFKDAACFWLKHILGKMKSFDSVIDILNDHFTSKQIDELDIEHRMFYGIADGLAGIGLVLISSVSDIEPAWDSAFF